MITPFVEQELNNKSYNTTIIQEAYSKDTHLTATESFRAHKWFKLAHLTSSIASGLKIICSFHTTLVGWQLLVIPSTDGLWIWFRCRRRIYECRITTWWKRSLKLSTSFGLVNVAKNFPPRVVQHSDSSNIGISVEIFIQFHADSVTKKTWTFYKIWNGNGCSKRTWDIILIQSSTLFHPFVPSWHKTSKERPSNVHNVHVTLDERWNNVVCQLSFTPTTEGR